MRANERVPAKRKIPECGECEVVRHVEGIDLPEWVRSPVRSIARCRHSLRKRIRSRKIQAVAQPLVESRLERLIICRAGRQSLYSYIAELRERSRRQIVRDCRRSVG